MAQLGSKAERTRNLGYAAILLAPALALFLIFVVLPVFQVAYYSLFNWNGIGPVEQFRGLGNFGQAFSDPIFRTALGNNLMVVFVSLAVQLPLAFVLALVIGRRSFKGEVIFRSIFFFPYVLAEIVTGLIWRFIYNPQFGLPTFLSKLMGSGEEIGLLGDPERAFGAILIVLVWKYIGFHMILYIAGLQGVPKELEDAAEVDGASQLQIIWHVVIPSIKNTILISVFLSIIGSFNVFDVVWALGQGGPVNSTETMVTYLYNFGFRRFSMGYGSAIAVIIFVVCFIFNLVYQRTLAGGKRNGD